MEQPRSVRTDRICWAAALHYHRLWQANQRERWSLADEEALFTAIERLYCGRRERVCDSRSV